ncbi:polysaccharide biosynthesis protein [Aquirufa antheringensis]|uniref:Polysaccharide biosynthesis protein n=2 Tax=Aquirufa antheringensis TaxID=2516559 RepID=A0A4Q9BH62_9BACT|nr:nucleoside-diphosphate sugar epimerase/dehydratase [Aquirufa antheringensis]MCZ2485183.1 polysaccharide biosynthesis protein [Aquirufa antheringensis]MCZ2487365.1 polysaccharide biosynthesis protein [Aquirufa antheringensis]MCZ2490330.1 polysaccharide biosynthesis protein [Aquirufa antheringensis]TBH75484.1 polysaccharide biosynthesis protein [Aquirufa antheringensis]
MTKSSFIRKYSNRFLSRWLVLVFDSLIVIFSFSIATLLRMNFQLMEIDFSVFASQLIFVLGLRLLAFLYFQSYAGIIRHTSIEDAILILKAVFAGSFGAVMVSAVIRNTLGFEHVFNLSASILIIDFFICLFWMVILRFFVKSFYESFVNQFKPTIGVLIYGAGYTGMLTKNVFQTDRSTNYKILGFIDDNESKIGKTIEGIKVYSLPEVLDKFVGSNDGMEVIMAINNMSAKSKRKISDIFLDRGVVVKALPPVDKWVEGEFAMNQIHNVKIEDLLGREVIQMNNKRIGEEISGKVILVTGAAGSIGSEIVRQLIAYFPAKLVLVDQAESALYDLEYELAGKVPTNVQLIVNVADVSDTRRVSKIFKNHRPDIIFHAAAYKHVPLMENNPYEAIKTNVIGTRILSELAAEVGVEKFVMVSTDKAVNPTNVMGATKRLAEMYTQSMNQLEGVKTKFIATRFGNVLGSNGSVIPLFKKQIERGGPVTVTHPEITRYFMTIPEACELVLEAATMGQGGEVFVFDMGESVKIIDLAKKMITLSGLRVDKDIEIRYTGLRPGEKLYEELLNNDENTLPTHHPKILIAEVNTPSYAYMEVATNDLNHLLSSGTNNSIVAKIKEIIPEYKSNNSVFETLDKKSSK